MAWPTVDFLHLELENIGSRLCLNNILGGEVGRGRERDRDTETDRYRDGDRDTEAEPGSKRKLINLFFSTFLHFTFSLYNFSTNGLHIGFRSKHPFVKSCGKYLIRTGKTMAGPS